MSTGLHAKTHHCFQNKLTLLVNLSSYWVSTAQAWYQAASENPKFLNVYPSGAQHFWPVGQMGSTWSVHRPDPANGPKPVPKVVSALYHLALGGGGGLTQPQPSPMGGSGGEERGRGVQPGPTALGGGEACPSLNPAALLGVWEFSSRGRG